MKQRVHKVVSKVLGISEEQISDDTSPDNLETWDSIKHMNLVLAIEEEFNIEFTDEQAAEIWTVGLIVEIVKESINSR